jgi:hypothetical protein
MRPIEQEIPPELVRRLSAAQKLAVAQQLRATAWMLAAAGLRARHPDLAEDVIQTRVRDMFRRANG